MVYPFFQLSSPQFISSRCIPQGSINPLIIRISQSKLQWILYPTQSTCTWYMDQGFLHLKLSHGTSNNRFWENHFHSGIWYGSRAKMRWFIHPPCSRFLIPHSMPQIVATRAQQKSYNFLKNIPIYHPYCWWLRNPAPVDRWFIPWYIGFQPSFWWRRISQPPKVTDGMQRVAHLNPQMKNQKKIPGYLTEVKVVWLNQSSNIPQITIFIVSIKF